MGAVDEAAASECRGAETAAVNEASNRPLGDAKPLGGLGERQPWRARIGSPISESLLDPLVNEPFKLGDKLLRQ